ncbi:MAG: hypothetical protein U9Q20_01640 [Campylobacterota bacterium]|nr:hypothetical protein [Campylobacterota bacterium]
MDNIQNKLKELIISEMIPESEDYLSELHELLKQNKANKDDIETIKDMESFLVELENIVQAIDENKLPNDQANEIYTKIDDMIHSSDH